MDSEAAEDQGPPPQEDQPKEESAAQETKAEEPKEEVAEAIKENTVEDVEKTPERPTSASKRPSSASQRPASGTLRPASGTERPGSGTQRPGSGTQRPGSGRQRPTSGNGMQRPSSGTQRPASATIRPPSASSNSSRSSKKDDTESQSSTARDKAEDRPSSARSNKESPRQEPASEPIKETAEQTEKPKDEPAEENNNEIKKENEAVKPGEQNEKKSPESTPRKDDEKVEQSPTEDGQASEQTKSPAKDSTEVSNTEEAEKKDQTGEPSAVKKPIRKKKSVLSDEALEEKTIALMEKLISLESYDNDETMKAMKSIGQLYWDNKPKRKLVADILVKMDFAGLALKFMNAFNKIGIFKSDSVWFPAYYTMNNMWNYTDGSKELAKDLVEKGIIPLMFANVTHAPYLENLESKNVNYVIKSSLSILQNVSRIPESKHIFMENKAIEALKPFTTSENVFFKAVSMMTLTAIINEADNAVLEDTGTIPFMVKGIRLALASKNGRYRGFTPTELTECLGRMAVNDSNKMKIVAEGALPLFTKLLQSSNPEEHAAAAQCLWTLSFDKDVRAKILEEPGCVATLEVLQSSEDKAVRTAARGAMWKLKGKEEYDNQKKLETKSEEEEKDGGHIMISYNWANQPIVLQIANKLKEEGYKVWLDVDQMGGSTLEAMAQAVERAAVVIICMSEKYKISPNCRTEGEYTFQLRKPIVPLLMQRKYRPDGWLGMLLGAKLFIDYTKYPFDKAFAMTIKELNGKGHPDHKAGAVQPVQASMTQADPGPAPTPGPRPQSAGSAHLATLTKQQVAQWLSDNGLQGCQERFAEMDGKLLLAFMTIRTEAPEYFYRTLETKFGLDAMDVLRLIHALTVLP